MSRVWICVVLIATMLAMPSGSATTETPSTLFLKPLEDGEPYRNLTTRAPVGSEPLPVWPSSALAQSEWIWRIDQQPAGWVLPADSQVHVVIWLDGLERAVPIASPDHTDAYGQIKVQAEVLRGSTSEPAASSSVVLDPVLPTGPAGPTKVEVSIPIPQDLHYPGKGDPSEDGYPFFGIQVVVTGWVRGDDPLAILSQSTDTPSSVTVPGFPLGAFRAWEDHEAAAIECGKIILQGGQCGETSEPVPVEEDPPETATLPTVSILLMISSILCLAHWSRRQEGSS